MSGINSTKRRRSISPHESPRVSSAYRYTQASETPPSSSAWTAQPQGPGFLGPTSYRAALAEELAQTGLTNLAPSGNVEQSEVVGQEQDSVDAPSRDAWRINDAMGVFNCLKHFSVLETLARKSHLYYRFSSMLDFFVGDCVQSVQTDLLENDSLATSAALQATVQRIFYNTSRPVVVAKSLRMTDYIKLFTGQGFRWEALAVFYVACGFCCHSVRSADASLADTPTYAELNRPALLKELLSASTTCVSLCEDLGNLTDLGLWAYHGVNILTSKVLGDSHPLVWRQGNDVSAHVISQGLHSESEREVRLLPFWLVEMRRRALANIYATDKLLCMFFGRPPRLSQRYCTIRVPVDVDVRDLGLDDESLGERMSGIDMQGWNHTSERSGLSRCFVLSSILRERILELALGPPSDRLLEAAKTIIADNTATIQALPSRLQFSTDQWHEIDSSHAVMTAHVYLDFLCNEFMLRRLLYSRHRSNHSELLRLSQYMLTIILEASNIRACQSSAADHLPWMVVLYGLPSAGLLAVELLRRRDPNSTNGGAAVAPSAPEIPGQPVPTTFSWTKVLQDLAVFDSILMRMHLPWEGNYELANEAHQSLQRVLGKVLSIDGTPVPGIGQTQQRAPGEQDRLGVAVEATDLASLQPVLAQSEGSFSSRPQEMVTENLDWDTIMGFDLDFWMDLPDGIQM